MYVNVCEFKCSLFIVDMWEIYMDFVKFTLATKEVYTCEKNKRSEKIAVVSTAAQCLEGLTVERVGSLLEDGWV